MITGHTDSIAAIATSRGNAGIGIIRISGPAALSLQATLSPDGLIPRQAKLVKVFDQQQRLLDQVLMLYFPAPNSFTGEDVLELQAHGGIILLDMLLEYIISLGCRQARAGEFSERAFLNGKIDLTQAEAISDLIEGQTRSAVRGAMRSLQGEFSNRVNTVLDQLIHLRTLAEAYLDFPDEEIDTIPVEEFELSLNSIKSSTKDLLSSADNGSLLRDGFHLVLAGKPNAGKSSLLNILTKKDTAIVSEQAGTTRDIIRETFNLDGLAIDISDTAGLRETSDSIETEGIRRAKKELELADRVLLIVDEADYSDVSRNELLSYLENETPVTIIRNKIDLLGLSPTVSDSHGRTEIQLSLKSGDGLPLLFDHLKKITKDGDSSEGTFTARRRHVDALKQVISVLSATSEHLKQPVQLELLAEDCRQAQHALNGITGKFTSEDLLGKIFSSFCIGK